MGNFGRVLWKLAQLGIVVLLVGLGILMVLKPAGTEDEERDPGIKVGRSKNGGAASSVLAESQRNFAEGHIDLEKLIQLADVNREIDLLAEGTTQVHQLVFWEIVGDQIFYRLVLAPYDRRAHELMMDSTEALFMSFHAADDKRVVPVSVAERIPTRKLRVATKNGYAAGWFHDGTIPLDGKSPALVDHAKVGWIFSGPLHNRLRKVQVPKDENGQPITDPFGIKSGVSGR